MIRPLTTQIVGSYSKPGWLADHDLMTSYERGWWRPEREFLPEAQDDAARLSVFDQERAGMDLLTDGEARRQYFVGHFLSRLGGVDVRRLARRGAPQTEIPTIAYRPEWREKRQEAAGVLPRVVDELRWPGPLTVEEIRFLKRHTRRPVKATVVGPVSAVTRLSDEHYGDEQAAALALAAALNEELKALEAEGADVLQIDEPSFHSSLSHARRYGVEAVNRMVEGLTTPVVLHVCYGYAAYKEREEKASPSYPEVLELAASTDVQGISLAYEQPGHEPDLLLRCGEKHVIPGLLNLGTEEVESPEHVASRIRAALEVVPPERLHPSSDCGMWFLPREIAFGKVRSLVLGTEIVRLERGL